MTTTPTVEHDEYSLAERLSLAGGYESFLEELDLEQQTMLLYDWSFWGRPKQLAPLGDWTIWLILAGRGWGKSRTGAEWIYERVRQGAREIGIVGATAADARDTMVEGPAGILHCGLPHERPEFLPSKRLLRFPNGAKAHTYSADEPDRLRGPQYDTVWADELATWRYIDAAWHDGIMFGLRHGSDPRVCVTTTPRPIELLKELIQDEDTHVTRGSTYENVQNLAAPFAKQIKQRYEGTRRGLQELYAHILDDNPNALWTRAMIEDARVVEPGRVPGSGLRQLRRIVVAVDPAGTDSESSDETGIVVVGSDGEHAWVLDDVTPGRVSPDAWGRAAVAAYHRWDADRVIGEVNNGGDMVRHVVKSVDAKVAFHDVRATRGKHKRAEPVSALYEQGKVHHVGMFAELEDQMCEWDPQQPEGQKSPDRMDAAVWALTELMIGRTTSNELVAPLGSDRPNPYAGL